jgi:hypothetical protein
MAGTIGLTRLSDYISEYQDHPDSKAADPNGDPAGHNTAGLLGDARSLFTRKAHS